MTMRGIDISNWQAGLIPSELDIDFCICKATDGIGFTDVHCDGFVQNCISHGILWGFYHFAENNDPTEEAKYFYHECENYFGHGIPVLDYEVSNSDNVSWCEQFLSTVHDLSGVWPVLYISASRCGEYENSWIPDKCGLWVAGYPYQMNDWAYDNINYNIYPWSFAAIWQFSSTLQLEGYAGNLDGDIAYMDADGWNAYAGTSSTPVQPTLSYKDLVKEIVLDEWGSGDDRKRMLESAGYDYDTAQSMVNDYYEKANEVIKGIWGNGWNRKNTLESAGYDYDTVQMIVNAIMG